MAKESYFNWVESLLRMQQKSSRVIVGTMSGTSIDGLDVALCRFRGQGLSTHYEVLNHGTVSYTVEQSSILRSLATDSLVGMETLSIYHAQVAKWHAQMVLDLLHNWGVDVEDVDLLASHGQTIRHAPKRIHGREGLPNSTFQLGDGDHLAVLTRLVTVHDFRQKHVAAGGEGAPLAGYGDQILFSKSETARVLLNVGGISNITVLDGDEHTFPVTFDTGPGNTLMDHVMRASSEGVRYDEGGRIAGRGKVNAALLNELKSHPYLKQSPPKTTGPEAFSPDFLSESQLRSESTDLTLYDLMATLNRFTAETIADSILGVTGIHTSVPVYVSGGGAHNNTLLHNLKTALGHSNVYDFSVLGVDADAKEAVLFAALANEFLMGGSVGVPQPDGSIKNVLLGKISLPW
jgi:anhydro-N-acetylmuramic acid kinase